MRFYKALATLGVLVVLNGCAGNSLDHYKGTTPQADLREYFNGPVKAWGIVQNFNGRVTRRFDVQMVGKWDGDVGTLTEDFTYYDGGKQQRVWTIKKQAAGSYEGTAPDIIDKAVGQTEGSAVRWNYVMDVPVDDTTYRLRFDDWMWVMNDGVLINRSYLKKFGITVAEITIVMQKQRP